MEEENLYTLLFHHGGRLTRSPKLMYVGGVTVTSSNFDLDLFSIQEVNWHYYTEHKGAEYKKLLWLLPGSSLEDGLRNLETDEDCRLLFSSVSNVREIHLYFIHDDGEIFISGRGNDSVGLQEVEYNLRLTESEEAALVVVCRRNEQEVDQRSSAIVDISNADDIQFDQQQSLHLAELYEAGEYDSASDEAFKPDTEDEDDEDDEDDIDDVTEEVNLAEDQIPEEEITEGAPGTSKKKKPKWRVYNAIVKERATGASDPCVKADRTLRNEEGYISEEFDSLKGSDVDEDEKKPPEFNQEAEYGHVHLAVEMTFPTMPMFKQAVKDYTIAAGRPIKLKKNEPLRCSYRCEEGCPWVITCLWTEIYGAFQIKTFNPNHSCSRKVKNQQANRKWVRDKLVKRLYSTPTMNGAEAYKYICDTFQIQVCEMKIYRALREAKRIVEGSEKEQYARLRDYCQELLRSNKDSTIGINCERPDLSFPPRFDRMYVGFAALKNGMIVGCRPLIGLDRCFLKGYYGGNLLAAVTQDSNNAFYVVAYAVVEQETKDTWSWFLTRLFESIGHPTVQGWQFISDMQKGLLPAMQDLAPGTIHRFCVKHLEANVWKQWRSKDLRLKLWACAKSNTMPECEKNLRELRGINANAWSYLQRFPPETWTRAGMSTFSKNQSLLSNMCEQFNATIVKYRGKPIITMLEDIRLYLMRKVNDSRSQIARCQGPITPCAQRRVDANTKDSNSWVALWAGGFGTETYQVSHMMKTAEKFVVDLKEHTCSCREWDLSGIPCKHAVAALGHKNLAPEDYVDQYFWKSTWEKIYAENLHPVRGEDQWDSAEGETILPPAYSRGGGRPKKQRKRTNDMPLNPFKAKRTYKEMTCGRCGEKGHNRRFCKGTTIKETNPKRKKKVSTTSEVVCSNPQNNTPVMSTPPAVRPSTGKLPVRRPQTFKHQSVSSSAERSPPVPQSGPVSGPPVRSKLIIPSITPPSAASQNQPFRPPASTTSLTEPRMQSSFQWRGQPCVTTERLQAASRMTRSRMSKLMEGATKLQPKHSKKK